MAISSSKAVILIVLVGGTAFKIVPFGLQGSLALGLLPPHALFLLPIQLFCLSDIRSGVFMVACTINGGFDSGVSVPLLLNMLTLRLATVLGLGAKQEGSVPESAASSSDAYCASAMVQRSTRRPPESGTKSL